MYKALTAPVYAFMSDYNNNHHNEIMSYMHELAGLLHYADENHKLCVSGETMRNAIDIARYYGQQYLAAVGAENYDSTAKSIMNKILQKARKDGFSRISLRDIKRTMGKNYSNLQIIDALDLLMQNGYISRVSRENDTRTSNNRGAIYDINPYLLLPETQNIPITN